MLLEGLEELPGVEKIEAHYKTQKLIVTFDDAVVNEDYIMEAVRKEDYDIAPAQEGV
jgi:copper chaperone CopZ